MPSGILPSARLAGVSNQDSGRYSRHANGPLASHVLQCRLTATWQLAILPKAPRYWPAAPPDASPSLGKDVSSISHTSGSASKSTTFWASSRWISSTARGLCPDRKSTRLNSSHLGISYSVFCLKKKEGLCVGTGVGPGVVVLAGTGLA